MNTVTVTASTPYDVLIEDGLLEKAGALVRTRVGGNTACIVSDDIVDGLYGEALCQALSAAQYRVIKFVLPHGESSKSAENYLALLAALAEKHFTRDDVIFALGGGVVGDLAGFAAATYQRGVSCVQIPTTLLSMVDSSVGGKTAINLPAGKNLVGAFWQPRLVVIDPALLETLPEAQRISGFGEVLKYGFLRGGPLYDALLRPESLDLPEIIAQCVSIKRDIVAEDEFETGTRKLLNLGHTVGHAVEKCSNFTVLHGHAVSIGMAVMLRAAVGLGLCEAAFCREAIALLTAYGLPVTTEFSAEALAAAAAGDKKRHGDAITLVLPAAPGSCILRDVPVAELLPLIRSGLEE